MSEESKNPSAGCQTSNFCSIVRHTYEERYNMYMSVPKEQLASMLAQRDIIDMPEACTECDKDYSTNPTITISASSLDSGDIRLGDKIMIDYQHDFFYEK